MTPSNIAWSPNTTPQCLGFPTQEFRGQWLLVIQFAALNRRGESDERWEEPIAQTRKFVCARSRLFAQSFRTIGVNETIFAGT